MEKFSVTNLKLMQLIQRRNLSKEREKQYNAVFKELFFLLGKTPSQLLEEAKKEQQPYLDTNSNPRLLDMDDRKINSYQFMYNKFLIDKNNAETTREEKLKTFRSFYNEYHVDLPRPLQFNTKTQRTRTRDIPSWTDVKNSLKHCKNSRNKAIVSLIATSGMRESDVVQLTIQDLLHATTIYHNGSIEDLLNQNPDNIIPCYDFIPQKTKKEGNLCITFNTPECTNYIFEYLIERIDKKYSVKPEDPLFRGLKHPYFMKPAVILRLFQHLNKKLNMGKDKNGVYGKFRAHNLRKLFSTTCRKNITNIVVKNDKYTELDVISIFTGHTPPNMNNSEVYDAVDDEDSPNNYLRRNYEALIPYLTIKYQKKLISKNNHDIQQDIIKIKESLDEMLAKKIENMY